MVTGRPAPHLRRAQSGCTYQHIQVTRYRPYPGLRVSQEYWKTGTTDPLLSSQELFDRIGRNPDERYKAYRAFFRTALDDGFVEGLRAATNGGWALGDEPFKRQIAEAIGRRVTPLARGRPPKADPRRTQLNLL